jgi:hypothetical protein
MVNPPRAVCITPTVCERVLLIFIEFTFHLFRSRTPAIKSAMPIARNTTAKREKIVRSANTLVFIISNKARKTMPVKIRLDTIRKPPIATLSLTSFRIQFHSTDYKRQELNG